jgi:catechol 2,3-dioxygenase-like lactoylglutathione lyase family enzyme
VGGGAPGAQLVESLRDVLRGRVVPREIHHLFLTTARFEEMKRWYEQVLHAQIVFDNGLIAFLTYDTTHHRIALLNHEEAKPRDRFNAGVDHIAFEYASLDDLLSTYSRLREAGIAPYWTINHGPTISFYYHDPDGNALELQAENFETVDELLGWLAGGAFDENPIGVDVEPERLLDARRGGASYRNIFERSYAGELA